MGKLLEELILQRLQALLVGENGLSKNQFGFRKGRSTLDVIQAVVNVATNTRKGTGKRKGFCALISIDIRNAFCTARWNICIETMMRKNVLDYLWRMIDDYLSDRWVMYEGSKKVSQRRDDMWRFSRVAGGFTCLERHVRRLSAHGPTCWNEHRRLRGWRTCRVRCWRRQNPRAEDQWKSVASKALVG